VLRPERADHRTFPRIGYYASTEFVHVTPSTATRNFATHTCRCVRTLTAVEGLATGTWPMTGSSFGRWR
jgi:hypothetical protein